MNDGSFSAKSYGSQSYLNANSDNVREIIGFLHHQISQHTKDLALISQKIIKSPNHEENTEGINKNIKDLDERISNLEKGIIENQKQIQRNQTSIPFLIDSAIIQYNEKLNTLLENKVKSLCDDEFARIDQKIGDIVDEKFQNHKKRISKVISEPKIKTKPVLSQVNIQIVDISPAKSNKYLSSDIISNTMKQNSQKNTEAIQCLANSVNLRINELSSHLDQYATKEDLKQFMNNLVKESHDDVSITNINSRSLMIKNKSPRKCAYVTLISGEALSKLQPKKK